MVFEIIGHIGVFCFLSAFFLLQKEFFKPDDLRYLGLNLVGAIMLLISLYHDWNLPAFILEVMWATISFHGILKTLRKRAKANT